MLVVAWQLSFPWYTEPLSTCEATTLVGQVRVDLEVYVGREEVELALRSHSGSRRSLRLRVGHRARCTLDGEERCWDAEGVSSEEPGPEELVSWCRPFLAGGVTNSDWEHRVHAAYSAMTTHAVRLADASALALAIKAPPSARLFVYNALLGDGTGRVEDVLRDCPAVLLVAASRGHEHIVDQVKRGVRLRDLVGVSVDTLGSTHRHAAALVRAAPVHVAVSTLWSALLVPEADVNDLPAHDARADWYGALSEWSRIARAYDLGVDVRRRLADSSRVTAETSRAIPAMRRRPFEKSSIGSMRRDLVCRRVVRRSTRYCSRVNAARGALGARSAS